ncbi:hypothetical protein [Nocardia alni]|uniref:hypothetical protein n=1 Tax=Nocardia alni TaxID=2815723 RepID=UPI001C227456|nr:hypothetical protein [Nocardia alni]
MPNSTWRLEHLDDYDAARSWHSQEAHIIDTTGYSRATATRSCDECIYRIYGLHKDWLAPLAPPTTG